MDKKLVAGVKLSGGNWVVWKFQTSVILKGQGLFEIVTGMETHKRGDTEIASWIKNDAEAQELLVTRDGRGAIDPHTAM
ncbi:hypothetical protein JTB14_001047 [Gonioctena quinquepunctata]|nr:hypothetical protein JTB14_001047 [Gonioctena quinquepunctata]